RASGRLRHPAYQGGVRRVTPESPARLDSPSRIGSLLIGSAPSEGPDRPRHGSEPTAMRIFISTGEPSGDLHAANLVRALRRRLPDAEFVGFGGPHLARAGARVLYPLVDLAIMWFGRVLLN